ncbi:MAG: hypothetical protein A3G39_10890 [Deltaproteobacteria bacterium RIFCSPLOWO2_12_FULL_43_16]|nr:MAG: hypothetical protein A2Z89_07440 [Deltaproteobacteria bacterium GWA2_43_19]OGQ61146.1 MAG: hypothetical protein A3G39_10890 [Deltaproteobacteria bacterium RIFCSPLOWO2_12_FULL_43_16]HBR17095.1 hypothetical protein [Deltaproteobacteria bacterium]
MLTEIKKRILVIDDESAIRMLLSELLSEAGYLIDLAKDGVDAIKQLNINVHKYDLIILDVHMPGMSGIAFCREIMGRFPGLKGKFLFMIGSLTEDIASFFKENAYTYITKPFTMSGLLSYVNGTIDKKGRQIETEGITWDYANKRREERFHWSTYCTVFNEGIYNAMPLTAKTKDISQNGVKISYVGEPLTSKEMVVINVMSLKLNKDAIVIWSKTVNALNTLAGVRFIEPIQLPQAVIIEQSLR